MAGPTILLLIVIGFCWKIVLTRQYNWLESPDLANMIVPWFQFQAAQFHAGRFPLWDPFLFGGQTLIGQMEPGLAYPLNWILFALPLDHGHISYTALNWYYVAIHYLAALFCCFLARDLKCSLAASLLAGCAFGLGGYVGFITWPYMLNGAVWIPLVFLFLFRTGRGIRPLASAALCGLFLGISWLSGHHQVPFFVTLAAAAVWLYFLVRGGRIDRKLIVPAAVFAVVMLLVGAFQTFPAYEYGHIAKRWVNLDEPVGWRDPVPYIVHQRYSLPPIYILGLIIPGLSPDSNPINPFIGVVGLTLAGIAVACRWRKPEVRIAFAVGAGGLFFALARNNVFHGILYAVLPLLEKARDPAHAFVLFDFAIAILMAVGLDALLALRRHPVARHAYRALAAAAIVLLLIIFIVDFGHNLAWPGDDRIGITALVLLAFSAAVYRIHRTPRRNAGAICLILALYLVEIGNVSFYDVPHNDDKNRPHFLHNYDAMQPIADFLKRQPGPLRVDVNVHFIRPDDVPFNFGDWFGIDTMKGYTASVPATFADLEFQTPRTKMLYGVNYAISREPAVPGEQELFRAENGVAVYRLPQALPRVWVVHDAIQVRGTSEVRQHLQNPAFDLASTTFSYETPPAMQHCSGDRVVDFQRGIDSVKAVVDMRCRGMVVMSENDAPGWSARVDGKPAPIFPAYTAIRGVVVNAGRHHIEMHYRPASVLFGAAATALGIIGALLIAAFAPIKGNIA